MTDETRLHLATAKVPEFNEMFGCSPHDFLELVNSWAQGVWAAGEFAAQRRGPKGVAKNLDNIRKPIVAFLHKDKRNGDLLAAAALETAAWLCELQVGLRFFQAGLMHYAMKILYSPCKEQYGYEHSLEEITDEKMFRSLALGASRCFNQFSASPYDTDRAMTIMTAPIATAMWFGYAPRQSMIALNEMSQEAIKRALTSEAPSQGEFYFGPELLQRDLNHIVKEHPSLQ